MHTEDPDPDKPQNGRGTSGSKRRRSFGELTEGWPDERRQRVRRTKENHERAIAAAADPAVRWDDLADVDLGLAKEDVTVIADALANPPKPNARLKKAARRHRKLVARKDREEGSKV